MFACVYDVQTSDETEYDGSYGDDQRLIIWNIGRSNKTTETIILKIEGKSL